MWIALVTKSIDAARPAMPVDGKRWRPSVAYGSSITSRKGAFFHTHWRDDAMRIEARRGARAATTGRARSFGGASALAVVGRGANGGGASPTYVAGNVPLCPVRAFRPLHQSPSRAVSATTSPSTSDSSSVSWAS